MSNKYAMSTSYVDWNWKRSVRPQHQGNQKAYSCFQMLFRSNVGLRTTYALGSVFHRSKNQVRRRTFYLQNHLKSVTFGNTLYKRNCLLIQVLIHSYVLGNYTKKPKQSFSGSTKKLQKNYHKQSFQNRFAILFFLNGPLSTVHF